MFAPKPIYDDRGSFVGYVATFLLVLTTAIAILGATSANAAVPDYKLGPQDKLKVTVFGQEKMSGQFSVGNDGRVALPFVGSVKAAGLTVRQLENEIVNRLKPDYLLNPRVSVEVLNYRDVYVTGEVTKTGGVAFRTGMTVITAIALAGGHTYRARKDKYKVRRAKTGATETVKGTAIVFPGDVIEVLERWF